MPFRKVKISAEEVEKMASIGCTPAEIAQKFHVSIHTITANYGIELESGKAELHEFLRQAQIDCAKGAKLNSTMLIFLGKAYLGQEDGVKENKVGDLDIFLNHLQKNSGCLNSQVNSSQVSMNPMPESTSGSVPLDPAKALQRI